MSHTTTTTGHRGAAAAILAVGGGGLAAATWVGGEHVLAGILVAFYAVAATAAFIWSGRDSDVGAIMRAGGDERQRRIDHGATALAGVAMGIAAIIGSIISAAMNDGDIGAFGLIAFVGGVSYGVAVLVLKRRN